MDSLKRHVPAGTQDYLPAQCRLKRTLEGTLRETFEAAGYDEIESPVFEHYDVFTHDTVSYVQEEIVKFFDRNGYIMALRPDVTGPIARMAATKLLKQTDILRLFYIGNVYGIRRTGGHVESTQAGVELVGAQGVYADAEPIALSIQALLDLGLRDFSIEIGQVAYFRGLLEGYALDDAQVEKIRALINDKNSVELEYTLSNLALNGETKSSLAALPGLFGNGKALNRAKVVNERCEEAIENLRGVLHVLDAYGFGRYVSVDLGLLHDFQYYTGILFRGLVSGIGRPVLQGGRYDALLREFGFEAPATGFAIRLTRLMGALRELRSEAELTLSKPIALRFDAATAGAAYKQAQALKRRGHRVILAGPDDPAAYSWNDPEIMELLC